VKFVRFVSSLYLPPLSPFFVAEPYFGGSSRPASLVHVSSLLGQFFHGRSFLLTLEIPESVLVFMVQFPFFLGRFQFALSSEIGDIFSFPFFPAGRLSRAFPLSFSLAADAFRVALLISVFFFETSKHY